MDIKEGKKKRIIKEISIDEDKIKSLLKTSANKLQSQELMPLNEITTNSKVSLAYNSLRELLEALSIKNGLKIYNHEGYTAFIKEIIKKSSLGEDFDAVRKIRNSINYYGKTLTIEECQQTLPKIKELITKIKEIIKNEN